MLLNNGSAGGTFRKNLVLEVAIFVLNCAFRNWRHTGWLVRTRASEGSSDSDIMVRTAYSLQFGTYQITWRYTPEDAWLLDVWFELLTYTLSK